MNPKQMHILLADDDYDDIGFFKEALGQVPVITRLDTVEDGEQLMSLLADEDKQLPDVLFLDINMPGMSGFQFLKEIKALGIESRVIFMTGFTQEYEVKEALDLGCFGFLAKPVSMKDLRLTITLITIPPRYIRPPEHFRCFLKNFPQT